MKVFISWSGRRSKVVADVLRVWIRCVLQATRPWLSARDIDRGAVWFSEISDQLKDTSIAIICLTHENKDRPWILFEAGAVMKGLSTSRICTLLIDLQPTDIKEPLYHFNHTLPTKESMRLLVDTINKSLGADALDDRILDQVFDTYWEMFQTQFSDAIERNPPEEPPKPRDPSDVLSEILENTRQTADRVSRLEHASYRDSFGFQVASMPFQASTGPRVIRAGDLFAEAKAPVMMAGRVIVRSKAGDDQRQLRDVVASAIHTLGGIQPGAATDQGQIFDFWTRELESREAMIAKLDERGLIVSQLNYPG